MPTDMHSCMEKAVFTVEKTPLLCFLVWLLSWSHVYKSLLSASGKFYELEREVYSKLKSIFKTKKLFCLSCIQNIHCEFKALGK